MQIDLNSDEIHAYTVGDTHGDRLFLDLAPGRYGLSFFVEGDLIAYHAAAQFSSMAG